MLFFHYILLFFPFTCVCFLHVDPETGEEYLLRRGECVNVLPGILRKVMYIMCYEKMLNLMVNLLS